MRIAMRAANSAHKKRDDRDRRQDVVGEFDQLGATAGDWNVIRDAVATISESRRCSIALAARLGVFPERGRCLPPNSPRPSLWRRARW